MKGTQVYRYSGFLLSFVAFSLVGGCAAMNDDANARSATKTAEVTSEQPHHGRAFRVGVLLPPGTEQANSTLRSAMQEAASTNNLSLNFETAQEQQPVASIERLRAQNLDALLLCARNSEDAMIVARPAGEGGIPLVVLISEPQQEEKNERNERNEKAGETDAKSMPKRLPGVVAEVAPRVPHVGITTSDRLSDVLRGRGGIVLITCKLDAAAGAAWNDLRAYLHRHPTLHVLETRSGPLPPAEGLKMIDRHGSKLNAVVSDDETTLRPLAESCRQKKRADVALFAFDASRATLMTVQNTVQNTSQKAAVQQIGFAVPANMPGKLAVQTVAATLRGEKPSPYVWADPVPVPMNTPSSLAPLSIKSTLKSTMQGERTR